MMTAGHVTRIRQQLQGFVEEFAEDLGRSERRHWCGKYLEGLLREGEHKSIEPLAARVGCDDQALQQFVNQSPWDHRAVLHRLRQQMRTSASAGGVLVLDDTSLPKQGRHSVSRPPVLRSHGKIANCQSIVTWHWLGATGLHWPLAAQLYLPAEWTADEPRMSRAGVPPAEQRFREKWRLALDLLDEMKPQLPAYQAIVFDAGYGVVQSLLAELEKQAEPYVAQVPGNIAAWPAAAVATLKPARRGRPRQHAIVQDPAMHPLSMVGWRDKLLQEPGRWVQVQLPRADGASVQAVAVRVQASRRGSRWRQPGAARWLLIEQLGEETFKYYLSNLPAGTPLAELVRLAHQRWCATPARTSRRIAIAATTRPARMPTSGQMRKAASLAPCHPRPATGKPTKNDAGHRACRRQNNRADSRAWRCRNAPVGTGVRNPGNPGSPNRTDFLIFKSNLILYLANGYKFVCIRLRSFARLPKSCQK
ncbi:IS701 family transposase [Termitidicoccus mucosus]|uniref:IS701 family transposase n=1 Tax=Termitidicoccus mucosus TaxID=1184151 RepID=UPI003182BF9E